MGKEIQLKKEAINKPILIASFFDENPGIFQKEQWKNGEIIRYAEIPANPPLHARSAIRMREWNECVLFNGVIFKPMHILEQFENVEEYQEIVNLAFRAIRNREKRRQELETKTKIKKVLAEKT